MTEQGLNPRPESSASGGSGSSWSEFLGIRNRDGAPGGGLVLPYRERHLNAPEAVIHGGIIATLLHDSALQVARAGYTGSGPEALRAIDCQVGFLRAARETSLDARARVLRQGREFSFVDARVHDEAGEIVAAGRWIFSSHGEPGPAEPVETAGAAVPAPAGVGQARRAAWFNANMDARVPGVRLDRLAPGYASLTVADRAHLGDGAGNLAPGILLLAADNSAVFSGIELADGLRRAATVSLALTLCEPVCGEAARVVGNSTHRRGDLVHNRCTITGAVSGRLKAYGTVSYLV